MAGYIAISDTGGVSMSTLTFDLIINEIKPYLILDNEVIEELYADVDTFNVMDLGELSNKDFMTFYLACFYSYVFDPRVSTTPIPKGDWEQHIRNINNGDVIIKRTKQ